LAIVGVWGGWHLAGVQGAAWGFLGSRVAFLAQDIYTAHLIQAQGWLAWYTLAALGAQVLLAVTFALCYFIWPVASPWLLLPAGIHAALMAAWLLRQQLRQRFARSGSFALNSSAIKP
jgi:hypothetical protein